MKQKVMLIMCVVFVMATMAVSAVSRKIDDYDMIMPRFGKRIYTDSLQKVSQTRGVNNNIVVGGGYAMNCAIFDTNNRILTNAKKVKSGDRVYLNYKVPDNNLKKFVKLGGWTGLTKIVKVQTRGTWSPDEK